jgi:hypothetical protein
VHLPNILRWYIYILGIPFSGKGPSTDVNLQKYLDNLNSETFRLSYSDSYVPNSWNIRMHIPRTDAIPVLYLQLVLSNCSTSRGLPNFMDFKIRGAVRRHAKT